MAESGSYGLGFRLGIKQILLEAQYRWLRPAEICDILRNYQKFHISPEAPNKPISGSIFLFDRKVLRYFRKDGHNWRKKKDGKTVKEAHEKLKVGSVDMLHCYYAHGEDNDHFQRRSYWLLEQDLMHIVFVHYLEVKGSKANIGSVRNSDTLVSNSENASPLSSSFRGTSPTSTLSSGYEDAESEDSHQASSRLHSYPEFLMSGNSHSALSSSYNQLSSPGEIAYKQEPIQDNWQSPFEDNALQSGSSNMNPSLISKLPHVKGSTLFEDKYLPSNQGSNLDPFYTSPSELKDLSDQTNFQVFPSVAQTRDKTHPNLDDIMTTIRNENYYFLKKPLISGLQTEKSLKKVDSFSRWRAKELREGDELNMQSSNGILWSTVDTEYDPNMEAELQVDVDTLSPSVPWDQLFSIIDFSPNWSYSNWQTKVLIVGTFLKSDEDLSNYRWSIMFGELEVQAEILADGILCCHAPLHNPGRVPFYITCSNRLACSNIQEFEYRLGPDQITSPDVSGDGVIFMHLYLRFEMILCIGHVGSPVSSTGNDYEKQHLVNKIISLMEEENNEVSNNVSQLIAIGQKLLEKQLKQNFYSWLLQRVNENGKGPTVVDDGGQSVLHLAAALGFNWALQPIIVSGVSIDFRDRNGWTALHWAAFCGREDTVAALVSLGAASGALTDPSAEYSLGRTPADLASSSGHKGISGFLAESTLTTHLSKLEVHDQNNDGTTEAPGMKAIHTVSERLAVPTTGEDVPDTLSLKDSLAAVCNATQAAARIHQIFRIQSFQRKQFIEEGFDESLSSDQHAVSFVRAKTSRLAHSDGMANSAALSIQKKFRGWKKRKEFLLIRQKIVKIQAHVRGHQVRKKYKTVVWSVGIMEKIILRWRRKRSGLRGFRSDEVARAIIPESSLPQQEDDYDFLKEGRKQSEVRMEKALSRVKSMAQYPEARAQYRRLLTAAEGFRETKGTSSDMISGNYTDDMISENIEDDMIYPGDDLIDLEALFDDDTFMSLAFQ